MKSHIFLPVLFLLSLVFPSVQASHTCSLEADITFFSVHLVFLEKNALRIERYELHELNEGDNYICRKSSNAHCTHMLNLGEQGMHVCKFCCDMDRADVLNIQASRGTKTMHYRLNWAELLLNDASQVQAAMHARTHMQELDQVFAQTDHAQKGNWQSSVAVSWGVRKKHVMNLIFERSMECVHAIVVPNVLCKECENEIKIMKKNELISSGILKSMDEAQCVKDDQSHMRRSVKASCCSQNACAQSVQNTSQSWLASLVQSLIAKIAALKASIGSLCQR